MKTETLRNQLHHVDRLLGQHYDPTLQSWKEAAESLRANLEGFGREISIQARLWLAFVQEGHSHATKYKNALLQFMATHKTTKEMIEQLIALRRGVNWDEETHVQTIGTAWNLACQHGTKEHIQSLLDVSLVLVTTCAHAPDKKK
jgi:hypothetical protein